MYQPKTCWSWLRRSFVWKHWRRSLPRVRRNPSAFNVAKQFHQRWTSLATNATKLRHRWKMSLARIWHFTVGNLSLSNFSHNDQQLFEDVVWNNLLFKSAYVTTGLFVSWMSGSCVRSITSQISLGIDQNGTARRDISFCKFFFVMLLRSFFHWSKSCREWSSLQSQLIWARPLCLYSFTSSIFTWTEQETSPT